MAIARKCDLCGSLYEQYNVRNSSKLVNGLRFLNTDERESSYGHEVIDCCPKCMESIQEHLESLKAKKE